ncbi:MAG: hypothetical protein ABEJ42_04890 [Halobacteriaceae archaeon]
MVPTAASLGVAPTVTEGIQLLVALANPLGTYLILSKPAVITWPDALLIVGGLFLPTLVIIGLQGGLPPTTVMLLTGILVGNTIAMVDDN